MNLSLTDLTAKQLRQAADTKERIDSLQNDLVRLLGVSDGTGAGVASRKKRTMSAAARARIAAAARMRWAKIRRTSPSAGAAQAKRKMSPAAKARLAAIAKARWKKAKSQGKRAL